MNNEIKHTPDGWEVEHRQEFSIENMRKTIGEVFYKERPNRKLTEKELKFMQEMYATDLSKGKKFRYNKGEFKFPR